MIVLNMIVADKLGSIKIRSSDKMRRLSEIVQDLESFTSFDKEPYKYISLQKNVANEKHTFSSSLMSC